MIVFNLQGNDFNWNINEKKTDSKFSSELIHCPKTPEEAITMLNNGQIIEINGKAHVMMSRVFEALGLRNYSEYNRNRKGFVTFIKI